MQIDIRVLDRRELPGFRPYLLPQTAAALERDEGGLIALGAVTGRSSCGAAAARMEDGGAVLTDLFVDAAARRQGVGRWLLLTLTDLLAREDVVRLRAGYVLRGEDLSAMDALLAGAGFSAPELRSRVFLALSERFHDAPLIKGAFSPRYRTPEGVASFSQLSPQALEELSRDEDILDGLTWETLRGRAIADLSVALVRDGKVLAYQLAEEGGGGFVLLSAVSRAGAPPSAFLTLLVELVNRCYYRAGGDFPFYFSTINDHAEKLALRLMGDRYVDYEEHTCWRRIEKTDEGDVSWQ